MAHVFPHSTENLKVGARPRYLNFHIMLVHLSPSNTVDYSVRQLIPQWYQQPEHAYHDLDSNSFKYNSTICTLHARTWLYRIFDTAITHTHTHTHTYNSPMVYQSWEIPPGCELDFHSLMWCF